MTDYRLTKVGEPETWCGNDARREFALWADTHGHGLSDEGLAAFSRLLDKHMPLGAEEPA